jgi:hypothetical protein
MKAPPGTAPPGRLLFPRRRSSLAWFVPALLVHLLLLIALLTTPTRNASVERQLPRWAIVLAAPDVVEGYTQLPPPPAALPVPPVARPNERTATQPSLEPTPAPPGAPTGRPDIPAGVTGPTTGAVAPQLGIGRPRLPIAERLRPGQGDRRLYRPLPEEIVGLSADQLAQLDLDLAIAEVMDSVAAAEAAGRRATDWTYTDSQGRRWGVSPGQIHLGGITIPLPFGFSAPRTADAGRRAMQDAAIEAQAGRAGVTTVLKDRAAEIRRRRDAERVRERGGERARPQRDTTGGM